MRSVAMLGFECREVGSHVRPAMGRAVEVKVVHGAVRSMSWHRLAEAKEACNRFIWSMVTSLCCQVPQWEAAVTATH